MIKHGALAQLGARHTGSVEATGSSPVCSTYNSLFFGEFFYCLSFANIIKKALRYGRAFLYWEKYFLLPVSQTDGIFLQWKSTVFHLSVR